MRVGADDRHAGVCGGEVQPNDDYECGSPPSAVAVASGSRFKCLADHDSESDTESVPGIDRRTRRRLSVFWRADSVATPDVPDSNDRRFLRVRRAMQSERQEQFDELAADPQPSGPICPRRGWEVMDMVDLHAEFRCRVRCLQAVPSFLRKQFRMALVTSLEAVRAAYHRGDHAHKCRSWKLFRLTSRMIFCGARSSVDPPRQSWREGWNFSTDRSGRCCEARHSPSGL